MNEKALIKTLAFIVATMFFGWMGWISYSVVGLSSNERENEAQWKAIGELRGFHFGMGKK